jgi:hypothetical protein
VLLFVGLLMSGCAPVVHHGPWVREGVSGNVLGAGAVLVDQGDPGFLLSIDGAVRYGFVPADTSAPALALGVQLPVLPVLLFSGDDVPLARLLTGDGYVTALRTSKLTSSIGFSGSLYHQLPYIQVGSRTPDDSGWYTTQSLFFLGDSDLLMWIPSFTWVEPSASGSRTTYLTLGAGLGSENGARRTLLIVAMTLEFHRKNGRVR